MMDMPLQFNMEKMGRSMPANNAGMEDMGRQGHEVSTSSDIRVGAGDGMMQSQMMGMMGGSVGMGPMSGGQMAGSMGPMTPGPMAGSMGSMTGGQMAGSMGPMTGMGYQGAMNMMGPDANMMMMGPMGYNQYGGYDMNQMGMGCPPEFLNKEIIELKCGMLYPPPPGSRPRSRREKPSGCRTVFVGSLPDGVTEENIYEIFDRFGNIVSVRLNKNNYCHIRYEFQDSVEYALLLSGYTLKMEEDGEGVRSKHLHVDYAHARDDQYEWECLQRALEREKRHRQRIEDSLRPPSPPPVTRFSEGEAQIILEKLKSDESFGEGSSTLLAWLSRGEVNRRSANVFYSLLQSTNAHVRALVSEKENREHEMENLKASFRLQIQGILNQFDHIENVFVEAQKQRAFDHFSKAQRKSIDLWCKQVQEIKRAEQEKFLSERKEDEMEMSDTDMDEDDGPTSSKRKKLDQASQQQLYEVREENDSLRCQLEAYRNDLDVQKHDWQKQLGDKDSQLRVLQQALQGMQQQLISFRQQAQEDKKKSTDSTPNKTTTDNLESEKEPPSEKDDNSCAEKEKAASSVDTSQEQPSTEHPTEKSDKPENLNSAENLKSPEKPKTPEKRKASIGSNDDPLQSKVVQEAMAFAAKQLEKQKSVEPVTSQPEIPSSSTTIALSEKETKIIGLVSCFLHVHPFGASTDYLWSYLQRLNLFCRPSEIEDLMDRLPMLYRIEMFGVGASLERRWKFIGYSGFN